MVQNLRGTTRAAPSATRSSTSGSSPESATSGRPRRSGQSSSRRGGRSQRRATRSSTPCFRRPRPDARLARWPPPHQPRVPPGRPAVPSLRRADPFARPGRRQPDRLLVPGLPALIRRVVTPVHRPRAVPEPVPAQVIETDRRTPSGWRSPLPTSTRPCARTASRPSPGSPPMRSRARSRSWSTSGAASTSTGRSCATISRACAPPCAAPGREDRARRAAPRAGGGDLRARRR